MATLRNYFKIISQCTEIIERINPDFVQTDIGIPFHGIGVHFHGVYEENGGKDVLFHMRPVTNACGTSPNMFLVQGFTLSEDNSGHCMMFGGTYLITGDGYSTLWSDDLPPLDPAQRQAEGCWSWEWYENYSFERDEDMCCHLCKIRPSSDDEIPAEEPPPEYSEVDTLGNDPPPTYN